ncbi:hypothetical protein O6H91_01G120800 [Diphasiastrum complanatum]|nr:hypothetical protein O6H91_01G120800 [Diphasiastrum complanatum]
MSKGKVTYPALTPKFGKSSNLDGSVAAAAQVVSQVTKDTSPKSTDDKWRKLVTVQEARLASATNIIMNMIGGHFDYDQMYQELRELGDERIRIEQHEKVQRKLLCLPNSLVGASTKLAASNSDTPHGKKGKVLEDDGQNRRLRHGSMLADPKSGSSTKRRRSTQSPARETGNKLPRLGFVEIKLRENIYNDQNLKSALFNRDVKTYPATEKKYKLEGHSMHQLQTFSDKVANSMLWNDQSETLGIDMDVLAEKKSPTNHCQKKESAISTRKDKIPAWVERICKPMQNLCESHCKHAHEKFPVSSNLRRRSVRPPGAFFKVGKPINWMQQPMKVIKDEAASRCMERPERLSYPIEDTEANNPHKRDTKHLVERNIQQRMKDFQGKGHMTYIQKDIFSNMLNNSSSLLVDNKYYPSLQKIHSGIMPSLSVEEKPAVSAIFEETLIKSSGSNLAVGKEIPDNGLDLQKVSEVSTAPKYLIIDSDKLEDRDKSTGAVSSASTCTIKGNGERPEEWMTVGDFGSEPNGSVAPICNPEIRVYGNAVAVLPEAASTSTVICPSLETAAEKSSTSSESEMVGPEPGHACETVQHQQQPFDLDAENSRHLSHNEQKASCSTHVETKYSKQPSIGYRTQLEEEVLKRALLEVILQSMLNEDNQQPATGDLQNKDHPSDLVAVSKIASWSLGSSQKHGDMQSGQKQETVSSSQTSTLDLSPVIECQTDTQASPVTQPPHSDLSQPLQSAYSSRATAVISHGGSCSSIGLSVWPWPVPMYVTADGRITATSQIPQFPLLQVSNNLCLSLHEASVALNQQVAVPITTTTIAVTQHPIIIPDSGLPNGSTKVHQEIAAGQEKDLERPKEDFSSPRTLNTSLCFPQHEASLIPSFAPNSATVPADSRFLDTPKCRDDGVIIAADAIARRYRPRQRARPGLRLEEMRSFTYRGSVDANEHCQEVFQAPNERALEFGRKQLLSTEADPEEQGTALGKAAFDATSCRNMPLPESPCEEGMPGLKDKNKMDEEQEHATLECEHPIVQLGQSKQEIVVGVMTQTEDFLRRESATKNEMSSLPAKKHVIEGGDYSHNLTLQKSYFQSTKWTKEEQSQLAAWSSIKNFSLSDTSPEHLSEQSLQRDECFLSAGEVNSYELGRTLFPLVSEDITSSSSNKISESFTSSSKDSSSTTGTCIVKLGCVRCEPAVESEGLLLSEGEFESGTVAYNVEEVGQLHPQLYIEPGEMENKELAPVSKLDEGFLRPRFFHEEEAAGSMSEGEVLPGCLGERGEIRKF